MTPGSAGIKLQGGIHAQIPQEPLKRMAGTLTRWFEPIVRYIRNRYSNGMTEGFNNKIADKKYKRYFGALHARG